ncbi:MAG: MFS transporter [Clostridia bacterium]|nr:MFS transporter [Clostridia bacterium]
MPNYKRTRIACYSTYLTMASAFVLPPMLFNTFHEMYGISYTLLGTLVLINFCTQLAIDLVFTFFSRYFNVRIISRIMPLITTTGLMLYAIIPNLLPQYAYGGLVAGTLIFSVAAGLSEVFISPLIAALPSDNPEREMSFLHSLYGFGVVSTVLIASLYFLFFNTESWMYLAFFFALLPILSSLLFCISPIPDMSTEEPQKRSVQKKRRFGLLLCVLCIFLGGAAENTMTNWISGFMETALGLPKAAGDILGLAIFALLLAVTRVLYAKFTPSITKTLLVSMIGAAVCYVVAGLSPSVILSFFACVLIGMFTSMLWPGTLILMEEKIPAPGIAAFALMAAGGDLGSSVAPQLLGIVVDKIAVTDFAFEMSLSSGIAPEEIGLKIGMLIAAIFPILGVLVVLYIGKYFSSKKGAEK